MRKTLIMLIFFTLVFANNASIGAVTIDGKIYNQISMRPEYEFGKIGLGLDIYFYIDDEGNLYEKSWDFSDGKAFETILDKIYYIRYNKPGDNFYFRIGGMSNATLGYGILVNNYSNMVEYPHVRRLGMDMKLKLGEGIKAQVLVSDFKRLPGLTALRAEFPVFPRMNIGVFAATDFDMSKGLTDSDDDNYPDYFDHFPNDDSKHNEAWEIYLENQEEWDALLDCGDGDAECIESSLQSLLPDQFNNFDPSTLPKDNLTAFGLDLGLKVTSKFIIYSQFAQLVGEGFDSTNENLGWGAVPIGVQYSFGPEKFKFISKLETRINSKHFMYGFWDQTYDLNRAQILTDTEVRTKRHELEQFGELKGLFFNTTLSMLNMLDFDLSYQHMVGEVWNSALSSFDEEEENKSFLASMKINTSRIPKLKLAEIYYQRNNDSDPFDFDNPTTNTIHGYNVGMELSSGVVLLYKGRTTYINDIDNPGQVTPNFSLQVETQIAI